MRYYNNQYLGQKETSTLVNLISSVKPRVVLEIGCNVGITAKNLLQHIPTIERYIGIDVPHKFETTLSCQMNEIPMRPGLWVLDDSRFYLLVPERGSSSLMPADLEPVDAVFIDGDHSLSVVKHDSYLARALLRPGGIIVWHDYGNESVEVTEALDTLNFKAQHLPDTWLAYWRRPHATSETA